MAKPKREQITIKVEPARPRYGVMPSVPQRDRKNDYQRQPKHKGRSQE